MNARVKQSSRYGTMTAFTGFEFVKYEWRPVPAGCEDEARKHLYLDVDEGKNEVEAVVVENATPSLEEMQGIAGIVEPEPEPEPETESEPEKEKEQRSRKRKA